MPHMPQTVNYTLDRGLPWERLIIIKNKYNHALLKPTEARAFVKTGTTSKFEITASITKENGVMLSMTAEETQDLPLGDLPYDVMVTINGVQRPVSGGTISVSALDTITPMEDTQAMEIRYKQNTDFRRTFTWKDSEGAIITVQNAYMQAVNSAGTAVVDLRWYPSKPNEASFPGMAGAQRGYLIPATGATMEMHIADTNTVPAGSFPFDLFVQDSSGDWDCLSSGTLVVEASVATRPT